MDASEDTIRSDIVALLPRLRRFALALTGNRADAEDLVQDTVERALRHLRQWQPGTRLDSWMFRIAQISSSTSGAPPGANARLWPKWRSPPPSVTARVTPKRASPGVRRALLS